MGELHEGDVIVELFGAVVALVDMDFRDGMVFFGSILLLQVPFTNTDLKMTKRKENNSYVFYLLKTNWPTLQTALVLCM